MSLPSFKNLSTDDAIKSAIVEVVTSAGKVDNVTLRHQLSINSGTLNRSVNELVDSGTLLIAPHGNGNFAVTLA